MEKIIHIALYLRISKADGTQDTARQLNELRDFTKSQNWKIVEEIEEHISGTRTKRSGTEKLINLAKSNKIQKVLIHEVSRLGRNACDTYNTVEELSKYKVSVFDFHQKQETLDSNFQKTIYANIILPVLAGLSEQWLQQHTYRIKSGLENAKKKGVQLGRPKKEKYTKEDEILKIRKLGYIEDEFGRRKKASYETIARYLEIGKETVRRVLIKNDMNGRIQNIIPLTNNIMPTKDIGIEDKKRNNVEKFFYLQNRRYLGNKYKLIDLIKEIVRKKCGNMKSFCDIFAGTGVVGESFNNEDINIISNDLLYSNYICLQTFLQTNTDIAQSISKQITHLNNITETQENYFSENFADTFFTKENAIKIGNIREEIEAISQNDIEKNILLCSLLYAVDKVANTVGHYDAFRKNLDLVQPLKLLIPNINYTYNANNQIYNEDANSLIRKINCDVLYIDPPYNSRQYSDAYHLLENLVEWKKPEVFGIAKKMNRDHIKSGYCLKNATEQFQDLIKNASCKHILFSYNDTKSSRHGRSNARISDEDIMTILNNKGKVEIFEKDYKTFTTGKSGNAQNVERIFYCKVKK